MGFKNYSKPFVVFERSQLESPRFENCRLNGFKFIDSGISTPVFRNAKLSRFVLERSLMWQATFDKCDLVDVTIKGPNHATADFMVDFYKRFRVAFQSQGDREEAAKFYYQERFQQLRGHVFPLIPRVQGLPGLAYSGSIASLYQQFERKQMTGKQIASLLAKNLWRIAIMLAHPKFLFRLLREKLKLIPDLVDWLSWGFGERPARVFLWMAVVLGVFTFRYYTGVDTHLNGKFAESLSCSTFNFATIGCEYRDSFGAVEGILGAISLALMVAGFANRTRY